MCCSVFWVYCVAVCFGCTRYALQCVLGILGMSVCCSVLQCVVGVLVVAACCSVLKYAALTARVLQHVEMCCSMLQRVETRYPYGKRLP